MHFFKTIFIFVLGCVLLNSAGCNPVQEPVFGETVTDVDGNEYKTVTIGTQTWMIENLKTTRFNDGTAIPHVADSAEWGALETPGFCWYDNDSARYHETYGILYNWHAVNTGKLAPAGWHVPTLDERLTLESNVHKYYYKSESLAKILAANSHWQTVSGSSAVGGDLSRNNASGFSALPGGFRVNIGRSFSKIDSTGIWWSASASDSLRLAWTMSIQYNQATVERAKYLKWRGYSVRCVKD
jgi:uncharacterized protein (TIGR02145 family)